MGTRKVVIEFLGVDKSASKTAKDVEHHTVKMGSSLASVGKIAGVGLVSGLGAAGLAAGEFIVAAEESARIGRQTAAVIKSTGGAAHVTAAQVGALATSISNKTGADDEAIQSGSNLLLTFCLEDSVQALSRRGWVHHHELHAGDEILSLDPDTGEARWETVDSMHRFEVNGDLIRWKSKQIDVATTPHHRWWTVGTSGYSPYEPKFMTTEQISGKQIYVQIGGGSPAGFAGEATYADDLVELAAWVHSEGHFVKWQDQTKPRIVRTCAMCAEPARNLAGSARCDAHAKGPYKAGHTQPAVKVTAETSRMTTVGLCQSDTANPLEVKRIRVLMDRLRMHGHRINESSRVMAYNGSTMVEWNFSGDLGRTIRGMLPGKKLTYDLVQSMTATQAALFLEVAIAGDGHVDAHGHEQFIQKDEGQVDVIAALAAMLGRRTTVLGRGDSIYFPTTNRLRGSSTNATPEHYEGIVWCPSIRTGIFMARNNGRTFWTGNTGIKNSVGKGNDVFNQATAAATDLAAAMNNGVVNADGMKSSSIQLGKALNDPIKGITALSRVGVSFTDQQKNQIKAMVKSGNTLGAQKIILKEMNKEFGGAAKAGAGAFGRLQTIVGNLAEQLGGFLLPVVNKVAGYLSDHLPAAMTKIQQVMSKVIPVVQRLGAHFIGWLLPKVKAFIVWAKANLLPVLRDVGVYVATKVLPKLIQFGRFAADVLLPIIKRLVTQGLKGAKDAFDRVRKALQDNRPQLERFASAVGVVVRWVATKLGPVLGWLAGTQMRFVGREIAAVIGFIGKLVTAVQWIVKKSTEMGTAIGHAWTAVKNSARDALRFVWDKFTGFIADILHGAARAFGWIPGLGPKLRSAAKAFQHFRDDVNAKLSSINDQTITVTAGLRYSGHGVNLTAPSSVGRRAAGGPIHGPGTGTSDTAGLYALSNGEHVWTAEEVRKAGGHGAIHRMRDAIRGMAAGGAVGVNVRAGIPSEGAVNAWSSVLAAGARAVVRPAAQAAANAAAKAAMAITGGVAPGGPPGSVHSFRGETLNTRTISMLLAAEKILGHVFNILQGSYSTRVAASGGTHSGGGVMDTDGPGGWDNAVSALRRVGFAAWHRTPAMGPWGHHIHSVAIGDPTAAPGAKRQVVDFLRGGDGLGHYKHGTPYVPSDQLAFLHKGEAVIPAGVNRAGAGVTTIVINGALDPVAVGRQVQKILLNTKRRQGGAALGLA